MSQENVDLVQALYLSPDTDVCALFRDELIDAGDRVVLLLRDYGRREDMDIEVEIVAASICTVREGKIARWEDYADREEALRAARIRE